MSFSARRSRYVALSGGVGGAKLALGLARVLEPEQLLVIANTGDDFSFLDLAISPDVDTLLYTLSGHADRTRGWGRRDESWRCRAALESLGGPTWFQLGDADLALHLLRSSWLNRGDSLETVTRRLAERLGVRPEIAPMSNDPVRTWLRCEDGSFAFQEYFVKHRCRPKVRAIEYVGADSAAPSGAFRSGLADPGLAGVFICPSNPYLSIGPILAVRDIRDQIRALSAPVIAVSPLVGGEAVKGPTSKIMRELGVAPSVQSILDGYRGLIDALIIHESDERPGNGFSDVAVVEDDILMRSEADSVRLAERCVSLVEELRNEGARRCAQ